MQFEILTAINLQGEDLAFHKNEEVGLNATKRVIFPPFL